MLTMRWLRFATTLAAAVGAAADSDKADTTVARGASIGASGSTNPTLQSRGDLHENPKQRAVVQTILAYSPQLKFTPIDAWKRNYISTKGFTGPAVLAPNLTLMTTASDAAVHFEGVGFKLNTNGWRRENSGWQNVSNWNARLATLTVDGGAPKDITFSDAGALADTGMVRDTSHTFDLRVVAPLAGTLEVRGMDTTLNLMTNTNDDSEFDTRHVMCRDPGSAVVNAASEFSWKGNWAVKDIATRNDFPDLDVNVYALVTGQAGSSVSYTIPQNTSLFIIRGGRCPACGTMQLEFSPPLYDGQAMSYDTSLPSDAIMVNLFQTRLDPRNTYTVAVTAQGGPLQLDTFSDTSYWAKGTKPAVAAVAPPPVAGSVTTAAGGSIATTPPAAAVITTTSVSDGQVITTAITPTTTATGALNVSTGTAQPGASVVVTTISGVAQTTTLAAEKSEGGGAQGTESGDNGTTATGDGYANQQATTDGGRNATGQPQSGNIKTIPLGGLVGGVVGGVVVLLLLIALILFIWLRQRRKPPSVDLVDERQTAPLWATTHEAYVQPTPVTFTTSSSSPSPTPSESAPVSEEATATNAMEWSTGPWKRHPEPQRPLAPPPPVHQPRDIQEEDAGALVPVSPINYVPPVYNPRWADERAGRAEG